jgi:type II secretory pathway pseudopilin PulG
LELVIAAIIVGGIIAFIAYPLFSAAREDVSESSDQLETLISQRDAAYDAIRDLDFDYQTGKLSQGDYTALRDKYKARAAVALQAIDAQDGNGAGARDDHAGARVEEEIARFREARRSPTLVDDEIEREVARLRRAKAAAAEQKCKTCGTAYHAGDTFCSKCGKPL